METQFVTSNGKDSVEQLAKHKLEEVVEAGRQKAEYVLNRVMTQVPQDVIVTPRALKFGFEAADKRVYAGVNVTRRLHPHALRQMASQVKIPIDYLEMLRCSDNEWEHELLLENLRERFSHEDDGKRNLVRLVNKEVRGFLSNTYKRLDSGPLVDAFVMEATKAGAVPCEGFVTDLRFNLRVVIPKVMELVPGEHVVMGAEWSNSDFGSGAHNVRIFMMRLLCTNGMIGQDALRNIHLGKKLTEDIEYSEKTYKLDTATTVSALRDTMRAVFSKEAIESNFEKAKKLATDSGFSWAGFRNSIAKVLTKAELATADSHWESQDVINLPSQRNGWRAVNVLSWMAKHIEDPTKRNDLERLAGEKFL